MKSRHPHLAYDAKRDHYLCPRCEVSLSETDFEVGECTTCGMKIHHEESETVARMRAILEKR